MKPTYIWMRPLLGIFMTLGLLALTGYLSIKVFAVGLDKVDREILVLFVALVQAVILMARDSHGFYYGTSQGSANKADTIDNIINNDK
jgi:hypothetical protein